MLVACNAAINSIGDNQPSSLPRTLEQRSMHSSNSSTRDEQHQSLLRGAANPPRRRSAKHRRAGGDPGSPAGVARGRPDPGDWRVQLQPADDPPRRRRDRRADRLPSGRVPSLPVASADARLSAQQGCPVDRLRASCARSGGKRCHARCHRPQARSERCAGSDRPIFSTTRR
jgi:hypothetical protein